MGEFSEVDPAVDGIDELRRHDEAEHFELPEPRAVSDEFDDGEQLGRPSKDPKTLEDLYDLYPRLGDGEWKLRITRLMPKTYQGAQVAGLVGDFYERLGLESFSQRFGGTEYEVLAMQPVPAAVGSSDTVGYRSLKAVKVRIPGPPMMITKENRSASMSSTQYHDHPSFSHQAMEPTEVQLRKIELNAERERYQREMVEKARESASEPTSTYDQFRSSQREAYEQASSQHSDLSRMWQTEVERLRENESRFKEEWSASAKEKDDKIARLQAELAEQRASAEGIRASAREEALRESRERYEDATRRATDESNRETARLSEDGRNQMAAVQQRHAEERRTYESEQTREREHSREESRTRLEQLEKMHDRDAKAMRENYEARISDMRSGYEQQLNGTRDQCLREVAAARQSEETKAALSTETSRLQVSIHEAEMQRLRGVDVDRQREVSQLRTEIADEHRNKGDVIKQMENAKHLAAMTGMVEGGGEAAATLEQPTGWQGVVSKLLEQAPKLVASLENVAAGRQEAREAREQTQQRLQQPAPRRPMALPPGRTAHPGGMPVPGMAAASLVSPPPLWSQPDGGRATAVPHGAGSPPPPAPAPTQSAPVHPPPSPVQPPAAPVERSAQEQPAPEGAASPDATSPPADIIERFFVELESAVQHRAVDAATFARMTVEQAGVDAVRDMLTKFRAQDVVQAVAEMPNGHASPIVTRDGRRYVAEVFVEAQRLTST